MVVDAPALEIATERAVLMSCVNLLSDPESADRRRDCVLICCTGSECKFCVKLRVKH